MSRHFPFVIAPLVRQIAPIRLARPAGNNMKPMMMTSKQSKSLLNTWHSSLSLALKNSIDKKNPGTTKQRRMAMAQLPVNEENGNQSG